MLETCLRGAAHAVCEAGRIERPRRPGTWIGLDELEDGRDEDESKDDI